MKIRTPRWSSAFANAAAKEIAELVHANAAVGRAQWDKVICRKGRGGMSDEYTVMSMRDLSRRSVEVVQNGRGMALPSIPGTGPTLRLVELGCLQRIADALEAIAYRRKEGPGGD